MLKCNVMKEAKAGKHPPGDEEIILRIINGEVRLYEEIMRKYNRRLFRISNAILNAEEDVEDVLQVSYVNAYRSLKDFKGRSSFSTWLIRIVINESMHWKKRRIKQQQVLIDNGTLNKEPDTPLNVVMNNELKTILEKAVSDLPENYRIVFVMREIEDMSISETMEALNLSEANVKVRLTRAKEALRENLGAWYKSEEVFAFHLSRCNRIVANVMELIKEGKVENL